MMDLRVAVVTGGARGLGKAFSLALAKKAGYAVVVSDIIDATNTVEEIVKDGGKAIATLTDVSDEESVKGMIEQTINSYGRVDFLLNNASMFGSLIKPNPQPFYQISVDEWDKVMAVNVKGLFLTCKYAVPHMIKQKKGKIVNISSGTFFVGSRDLLHYGTSKGAVIGFTRSLARQLGQYGIGVNAVTPGATWTEATQARGREYADASAKQRCFQRVEMPEDLVGTILFLATEGSDFITGQTINVDGGSYFH
jgi:NAD(P)-dependent dehydrogenase (short-subunit alcohol dehydrogenase family)